MLLTLTLLEDDAAGPMPPKDVKGFWENVAAVVVEDTGQSLDVLEIIDPDLADVFVARMRGKVK